MGLYFRWVCAIADGGRQASVQLQIRVFLFWVGVVVFFLVLMRGSWSWLSGLDHASIHTPSCHPIRCQQLGISHRGETLFM